VGRLAEAKRIDLLVQAVNIVSQAHDVELVLCGDGTLRADLMSLVEGLGLADRVAFAGYGNPFPWVASADLFVLSSDHEGSPNALIEANGLGVPAVSTDCDFGPSEIIEDGTTGWLVGVGDVDALATTIGRVISDRALLTVAGAAARDRARVLFDASTVTHMLAQHLKDLSGVGKSDRLVPMNAESERFSHPHRSTNSESNVPPEA
jgi:glycosyltransferase involved in cell wall biosynthesis